MDEQKIIDLVTHHMNGGLIEAELNTGGEECRNYWEVVTSPRWNFAEIKYRKLVSNRYMNAKAIKGKTLINFYMQKLVYLSEDGGLYLTVKEMHEKGYRLAIEEKEVYTVEDWCEATKLDIFEEYE